MENSLFFDRCYRNVPQQVVDELTRFRGTHPIKRAYVHDVRWEYFVIGRGAEALLILPRLLGIGEVMIARLGKLDACVSMIKRFLWISTGLQTLQTDAAATAPAIQRSGP